ncbi:MAG: hypothetical protein HY903_00805 [Deltaproteobacteria bacterium]|nr:hypothetical protein [Deltaproteobacteria bacterium]
MSRVSIPVRSPTGPAWVLALMSFIAGGEILYEALKDETATFFHVPFADAELYAAIVLCGVAALVGFAWLISLYVRPGSLVIDQDLGTISRTRPDKWRTRHSEAPLADWHVRLQFFSEEYRARGAFRRVELQGPGLHEVLLLSDVPDGGELTRAFEAVHDRLGTHKVELQRPS